MWPLKLELCLYMGVMTERRSQRLTEEPIRTPLKCQPRIAQTGTSSKVSWLIQYLSGNENRCKRYGYKYERNSYGNVSEHACSPEEEYFLLQNKEMSTCGHFSLVVHVQFKHGVMFVPKQYSKIHKTKNKESFYCFPLLVLISSPG